MICANENAGADKENSSSIQNVGLDNAAVKTKGAESIQKTPSAHPLGNTTYEKENALKTQRIFQLNAESRLSQLTEQNGIAPSKTELQKQYFATQEVSIAGRGRPLNKAKLTVPREPLLQTALRPRSRTRQCTKGTREAAREELFTDLICWQGPSDSEGSKKTGQIQSQREIHT